ncbi:fumarylacetoacetate hydrolase family protein [Variovorax atrisoli]|uniref:fumarylacetoacetate hydrolase family protein n=1 Tax=Variovorax atrisoli TaxID=3394203 RepID=UPI000363F37D|nr:MULTISPECIES: fumarylacetoacetate hydrolase family protein [Variovorax]MBB3641407.1 5-carboxymethyl-2-hydroxymuconate isomerase [Variovorax sp. BK613]
MKLISYLHGGSSRWGCVVGDGVIDLGRRLPAFASVSALLAGGEAALAQARAAVEGAMADHALADVRFELPIARPRRVFCIGVNYAHRNAEYKDGSDLPKYPSIFMRVAESFAGHGEPLLQPLESTQLDYEGEIAIVIGRRARRVNGDEALACIAGVTCMNEGTIRDWVHHAKFNVTQGKNFNASGSIGPWIVTADEFPQGFGALRVSTRVNGEQRQDDTTENLMFDFAYLVHYLSTFTTLEPGDIIATGTPTGAGIRFDPPRFLKPGDVVEVEVSGVGVLRNVVRAEEAVQ